MAEAEEESSGRAGVAKGRGWVDGWMECARTTEGGGNGKGRGGGRPNDEGKIGSSKLHFGENGGGAVVNLEEREEGGNGKTVCTTWGVGG